MTSGLAGRWWMLLQTAAGGRHGRHLESMMPYQKSNSVNRFSEVVWHIFCCKKQFFKPHWLNNKHISLSFV